MTYTNKKSPKARTPLQESQFHLFSMTGFFKGVATRIRQFQENPLTPEPLKSNLFLVLDRVNLINLGIESEWKRKKEVKTLAHQMMRIRKEKVV